MLGNKYILIAAELNIQCPLYHKIYYAAQHSVWTHFYAQSRIRSFSQKEVTGVAYSGISWNDAEKRLWYPERIAVKIGQPVNTAI